MYITIEIIKILQQWVSCLVAYGDGHPVEHQYGQLQTWTTGCKAVWLPNLQEAIYE